MKNKSDIETKLYVTLLGKNSEPGGGRRSLPLIENKRQSFSKKLRAKAIPSYTCMEDGPNVLHLYQLEENISKNVSKSSRPLQVVSESKNWSAMVGESPGHENNAVVWWSTRKDAPKTKKANCPTRKLAGRGRSGRPGEILVSHPCTTFQTRKTRFVQKTNQNGCKTRDREAKHAAKSPEN